MTLFTRNDIPDDCQLVEQVVVWGMQILQFNYPDLTFTAALDDNGDPVKIRNIEANDYYYTAPSPAQWAYAGRILVPLNPAFQVEGKTYKHAKSFGDAPIPPQLRRVA